MLDSQFNVGPQAAAVTTGNGNGTGLSAWDKKNHRRGPSSVRRKSLKFLVKKAVSDARDTKSEKKKTPTRTGPQHRASMPSLGTSALMPEGWERHIDETTGNPYYVDLLTGLVTWDAPYKSEKKAKAKKRPKPKKTKK